MLELKHLCWQLKIPKQWMCGKTQLKKGGKKKRCQWIFYSDKLAYSQLSSLELSPKKKLCNKFIKVEEKKFVINSFISVFCPQIKMKLWCVFNREDMLYGIFYQKYLYGSTRKTKFIFRTCRDVMKGSQGKANFCVGICLIYLLII